MNQSSSHPQPGRQRRRVPAPSLLLALSLHFWFGAIGAGLWYMEWLVARADGERATDNMGVVFVIAGILWLGAGYTIVRTHASRPRTTWLILIGWIVAAALLHFLR